jgi:hypothetical protein
MYSPESVKWVWEVEHVEVKFVISKFTSILKKNGHLTSPFAWTLGLIVSKPPAKPWTAG